MSALKKAVISLFGGRGKVPKSDSDLATVAPILFKDIKTTVQEGKGESDDCISRKDLYAYLVAHSESGISKKTVDKLFAKCDLNGDGELDEQEFLQVLQRCYTLLSRQFAVDDPALHTVPNVHVVPGSSAHNSRSGTQAFKVAVVRRASMRRLWQAFSEVDTNCNGYISLPEFKRYIRRKQDKIAHMSASIFQSLDDNKDGQVTFQDLLHKLFPAASKANIRILMRMAKPREAQPTGHVDPEVVADVRSIFKTFAGDDGALDIDEFTAAIGLIGFDEGEAADIFKEIDVSGDGQVTVQEFEEWYNDGNKLHARKLKEADVESDVETD